MAAVIGHRLRLAAWWVPIQVLFPVGVAAVYQWQVPGWLYLLLFGGLALIFWNAGGERVPLYLSNRTTHEALSDLIRDRDRAFLDLGSGIGGPLFSLAGAHPAMRFQGIESAPGPFLLSRLRLAVSGLPNVGLTLGDFDVVYAFLPPAPMERLYDKVVREMKPGSLFISNSFAVPGQQPNAVLQLDDKRRTQLFIWQT